MKKLKVKLLENAHNPNLNDYYRDNIFLFLLRQKYDIELVNSEPDILIYPLSHNGHKAYNNCVKIFQVEEPGFWDKNEYQLYYPQHDRFYKSIEDADLVLSSYYIDNNSNVRFPSYLLYYYQMVIDSRVPNFEYFFNNREIVDGKLFDRKFCVFIHQNTNKNLFRTKFFEKLNKYKTVDVWNDPETYPGYGRGSSYAKTSYVNQNYKFCFAMENSNSNNDISFYPNLKNSNYKGIGYTTEKIIEPFCSKTIPLYWGNPIIHNDFNKNMFINWEDYKNDELMIEKILEIDSNKDEYMKYLNGIVFNEKTINSIFKEFHEKLEIKLKEKMKI